MAFKIGAWPRRAFSPDALAALWRGLHRLGARLGYGVRFYRLTMRGLRWVCGMRWVQERFFRQQSELMASFLAEIGAGAENLPQAVQTSVLALAQKRWRLEYERYRLTVEEMESLVTLEGWPIFEQARGEGKGVLLLWCHLWGSRTVMLYLEKLKLNDVMIGYARKKRIQHQGLEDVAMNHALLFTRDLLSARDALNRGGVVSILPDGNFGPRTVEMPFFGRPHRFRTGFAELALLTGATVIPVVFVPQGDGRVHARFASPLEDDESLSPPARQRALLEQYVAYLEQMWRDNPGAINPGHIARYLRAARGDQAKHSARLDG
jgi:lauroyl/myristoyl acyltransferase